MCLMNLIEDHAHCLRVECLYGTEAVQRQLISMLLRRRLTHAGSRLNLLIEYEAVLPHRFQNLIPERVRPKSAISVQILLEARLE